MRKIWVFLTIALLLTAVGLRLLSYIRGESPGLALEESSAMWGELRERAVLLGERLSACFAPTEGEVQETPPPKEEGPAHRLYIQTPRQTLRLLRSAGEAPAPERIALCEQLLAVPSGTPSSPMVETEPLAVARFLEAQSVFGGLTPPENVSYAMPELGISYASPAAGSSSSGFGYRVHPISGATKFHYGTDFALYAGTELCSFADGQVLFVGEEPEGYGKYLVIAHEGECSSLYAHCSRILVEAGQWVAKGETIAISGDTGLVTGPHLHFELRKGEVYLNPELYCGGD